MINNFKDMIAKAVEIRAKYSEHNPKQWGVEQVFMGMMKDIGDLSKILMIYNNYRDNQENQDIKKKLEHELSDVLYSIMIIANKTGIDLKKSFWETMSNLELKNKK